MAFLEQTAGLGKCEKSFILINQWLKQLVRVAPLAAWIHGSAEMPQDEEEMD